MKRTKSGRSKPTVVRAPSENRLRPDESKSSSYQLGIQTQVVCNEHGFIEAKSWDKSPLFHLTIGSCGRNWQLLLRDSQA